MVRKFSEIIDEIIKAEEFSDNLPRKPNDNAIKQSESDCLPTSHISSTYPVVTGSLRPGKTCSNKFSLCSDLQTAREIISQHNLDYEYDDLLFEIGRQAAIWFRDNG